ncbi:hypothetical protein N8580_00345 [Akkermansiaceae bacterium]|jgi:hypothetical protein|nr:hypothetical protein [Akkermansiaceae bacterium]
MSKNSPQQRMDALKDWDQFMQNEYPNYKERKKRPKSKPPQFLSPEDEDLEEYYNGK